MNALSQHLKDVRDPRVWLDHLDLAHPPEQNLWLTAVAGIGREADNLLSELAEAMDALTGPNGDAAVPSAWSCYIDSAQRSEEIFRECMELLGGIALRDRLTDEFVWSFADELISECAEAVGQQTSFAIPAFERTISTTMRRVARVNFPDWHLWTLPLVAYEYGQVVIRETALGNLITELAQQENRPQVLRVLPTLRDSLDMVDSAEARNWVIATLDQIEQSPDIAVSKLDNLAEFLSMAKEGATADLARASARALEESLTEAEARLGVLVADVFATFSTGPAYACAAIILRLNPDSPAAPGRPSDNERAKVVMNTLHHMTQGPGPHFSEVKARLQAEWATLAGGTLSAPSPEGGSQPESPVATSPSEDLPETIDVEKVVGRIRERVPRPEKAEYNATLWKKAKTQGGGWWQAIANEGDLTTAMAQDDRLRDVLNSAWYARLEVMKSAASEEIGPAIDRLTTVAIKASTDVANSRAKPVVPVVVGGKSQRPEMAD